MSLEKLQIWVKNQKVCQNHQKSTNVVFFCDNSFDKSLVLILKYSLCVNFMIVRPLCTISQYFEFEKKKKIAKNCHFSLFFAIVFFFSNSKYCDIVHNSLTIIKFTDSVLLRSKLKICRRNCHKNQHLLILVKFLIFDQIWSSLRLICGFLKSWETEKLRKTFFIWVKMHVDYDSYP